MRRAFPSLFAVATASLVLAGCGTSSTGASGGTVTLTVLGAASLTNALPQIGRMYSGTHRGVKFTFSFAGTDALTAQIEQGAPADVFAGASKKYGDQLASEGLVDPYRAFATNRLILILPAANPAGITSLMDLTRPGIKLVVGAESVPVGAYTRTVLATLDATYGAGYSKHVLANVVSNEDSVAGVLSKVRLGEADAGFVYVTDARSAGSDVKVIDLPEAAQAVAVYPIAVVKASKHPGPAADFVGFVLSAPAQAILQGAGFGPPPTT